MTSQHRTDDIPDELPTAAPAGGGLAPRQRSPRTDPSMRDGDSSHGNPYEMEGEDPTTDNDTGDMEDEPIHARFDGGAADGTTADLRHDAGVDDDDDIDSLTLRDEDSATAADLLDADGPMADGNPPPVARGETVSSGSSPEHRREYEGGKKGAGAAERSRGRTSGTKATHGGRAAAKMGSQNLPIENYERLTVDAVIKTVESLSANDIKQIRTFEAKHRNRKTLLAKLDRLTEAAGGKKARGENRTPGSSI